MRISRLGAVIIVAIMLLAAIDLVALAPQIDMAIARARAGCWPWSPAMVDLTPHMILCPGQVARIVVPPFPVLPADPLPPGITFPPPDMTFPLTPLPAPKEPLPPCSHASPCNFEFHFTFPLDGATKKDEI